MGRITKPSFEYDDPASSEDINHYLSEATEAEHADIEDAILDTYEDLRFTAQSIRTRTSNIDAHHGYGFRQSLLPGTSPSDDFVSAAVPNPLPRFHPASPIQFNVSRRESAFARNSNSPLRSLSVRSGNSQRSVSNRYGNKSDSVLDPDTPTFKRHSSSSYSSFPLSSPSPLRNKFSDSDEALPITPTRPPRRNNKASLSAQLGILEDVSPHNMRNDIKVPTPIMEPEEIVSTKFITINYAGVDAAYQLYEAEKSARRSEGSTPQEVSVGSIPGSLKSPIRTASVPLTARAEKDPGGAVDIHGARDDQDDISYFQLLSENTQTQPVSGPFKGVSQVSAATPSAHDISSLICSATFPIQQHKKPEKYQDNVSHFMSPSEFTPPRPVSNHFPEPTNANARIPTSTSPYSPRLDQLPSPSLPNQQPNRPNTSMNSAGNPLLPKRTPSWALKYGRKFFGPPPKHMREEFGAKARAVAQVVLESEEPEEYVELVDTSSKKNKWKEKGSIMV